MKTPGLKGYVAMSSGNLSLYDAFTKCLCTKFCVLLPFDVCPVWLPNYLRFATCFFQGKSDVSRRFLEKSTYVEPNFGLAMLVQGHSFASDGHHDQAMASYFKAAKLIPK